MNYPDIKLIDCVKNNLYLWWYEIIYVRYTEYFSLHIGYTSETDRRHKTNM